MHAWMYIYRERAQCNAVKGMFCRPCTYVGDKLSMNKVQNKMTSRQRKRKKTSMNEACDLKKKEMKTSMNEACDKKHQ